MDRLGEMQPGCWLLMEEAGSKGWGTLLPLLLSSPQKQLLILLLALSSIIMKECERETIWAGLLFRWHGSKDVYILDTPAADQGERMPI